MQSCVVIGASTLLIADTLSAILYVHSFGGRDHHLNGATVDNDFHGRLIETARTRLAPDLRYQFDQLSSEAQEDIAVTLMYCADRLPQVFNVEDLDTLVAAVAEVVNSLTPAPDAVH